MNQYVTGAMIHKLREERKMKQSELAQKICVSDKTISKWENGKGYPDISLLEPLARALNISVVELLSGNNVVNTNRASNMKRSHFHVCPACGNILLSTGEALLMCHGIQLPSLEAEAPEEGHKAVIQMVEDEYLVEIDHPMSKEHYISFIAGVSENAVEIVKMYPEMPAQARFKIMNTRTIYYYCNRDGLYSIPARKTEAQSEQ